MVRDFILISPFVKGYTITTVPSYATFILPVKSEFEVIFKDSIFP